MKFKIVAAAIAVILSPQVSAEKYKIVELGALESAKHSYVTDINNNNETIGLTQGNFNYQVDLTSIDFSEQVIKNAYDQQVRTEELKDKEITFTLDDIESGNLTADSLSFMLAFLNSLSGNPQYQKVADTLAVNYQNGVVEQTLFDVESPDYEGLTRSVSNNFTAITDDGTRTAWGSAPYIKEMFTPENKTEEEIFYTREFSQRAVVIKPTGEKTILAPDFNDYGGVSIATDIVQKDNGEYIVVGDVSTAIHDTRQAVIDDNCDGLDEPIDVCVWIEKNKTAVTNTLYDRRAVKWTLDANYDVKETEILGLAITLLEDEKLTFRSTALAINKNEIAVGYSHTRIKEDINSTLYSMPVYFREGETHTFIDLDDDWRAGVASDINDSNILVGHVFKPKGTDNISKFFYHNTDTNVTTFPDDYFSSSSSVARAINNHGLIVGEGEVESTNSNPRREAFLYDINAETFTNINDFLPCFSEDGETPYPYVVTEATGINEQNVIVGTATKTVPKRDSFGNVVAGEEESIVVAIKLEPTGGEIDNCPAKPKDTFERSGASFQWLSLLLLPLIGLRRRLFS